jgi:AAA15 family ATPase/GTPase
MLKKLILENWKSFRYAELPIDSFTVLIGANASGKSNAIEAFCFLQKLIETNSLATAIKVIRGNNQWLFYQNSYDFEFTAVIQGEDKNIDYWYRYKVQLNAEIGCSDESLIQKKSEYVDRESHKNKRIEKKEIISPGSNKLFLGFDDIQDFGFALDTRYNSKLGFLSAIELTQSSEKTAFTQAIVKTAKTLENIFILNPKPEKMRNYAPLDSNLSGNAANIAGVLAQLSKEKKSSFNQVISSYIKHLPERDIQRVWATAVGELQTDAMLYCEEEWKPGEKITIDARSMSDGTLRFLAILTALLTRPEGSQLIIEDIDDGLHPSRFDLLLKMLQEIGSQRNIDILVTTHNPAFLDRLSPEMTPFIIVAHRDPETGESRLTPLEDIDNFPKLYASDSLGDLVTKGAIERGAARTQKSAKA